jgi:multiple sugar transport system substrate-binding protein
MKFLQALATSAAVCIGLCGSGNIAAAQAQTELTVWGWASTLPAVIQAYQDAHTEVKVTFVNTGGSPDQYRKIRNAIRAHTGLPDVAQIESSMLPSFRIINALGDLAPYGLAKYRADFVPWTWDQVAAGSKVFSLPWDGGPVAMYYRQDIFEKYRLEVPATWAEFETQARKLRAQTQSVTMTNMNLNQDWIQALLWQAGAQPFTVDGTSVKVAVNSTRAKEVALFWQRLLDDKLVEAVPGFQTEWFTAMDHGHYATWIGAKWAVPTLKRTATASVGQWRVAPIPQWRAGNKLSASWGGSNLVVPNGAQHVEAAARFIEWSMTGEGARRFATAGLWPTTISILDDPGFAAARDPLFGDQEINRVFIESQREVPSDWNWSPFQDFVNARFSDEMSAAASGHGSFVQALDQLQTILSAYASQQGFTLAH